MTPFYRQVQPQFFMVLYGTQLHSIPQPPLKMLFTQGAQGWGGD